MLLAAAALGALLLVPGAGAHRDPCHARHACPSDHHTYAWQGLSCTSYRDERTSTDTRTVVYDGRTYWCARVGSAPAAAAQPRSRPLGRVTRTTGCRRGVRPDRRCSPGAVLVGVTRAQVCTPGWAGSHREVPASERAAVYAAYGIVRHPRGAYELDHIVSLELGGSNDAANLFPEPAKPAANGFHVKDRLENELHREVCAGRMTLAAAQRGIASDWLALYARVFG